MMEWWINFHFLRPWWLLLLLIPLYWWGRKLRGRANKSSWEKVIDERLLTYLLVKGSSGQRRLVVNLAVWGLIVAIIAAAGPSWQKTELPALMAQNPLLIALNLSSDMQEQDLSPSRLERAKYKIVDLLNLTADSSSGLMVYSSEPFMISPFSDDTKLITNLLPALSYDIMPANGDRADRAIELAAQRLRTAGFAQGQILLIAPDIGQGFDRALAAAKQAQAAGFAVNVLGVSAQDNEKLALLAREGGGIYVRLSGNDTDVQTLAKQLRPDSTLLAESQNTRQIWLDSGYYLLVVPLLCCLYFFRQGILIVALLLVCRPAEAGFWRNANQDGLAAFEQGDFAQAAASFTTPEWKGAGYYRQGRFEEAYLEFAKDNTVTALYNQGNALAKGGKIEEAIAKYEQVLEQEPGHEDAKFNLEYLRQQQNQQQQQNQSASSDEANSSSDNQSSAEPQSGEPGENQEQSSASEPNQDSSAAGEQDQSTPGGQNPEPSEQQGSTDGNSQAQPQPVGEQQTEQPDSASAAGAALQQGEADDQYDEEIQARAQQYREIPEDPGGLLKAIIDKEYRRNRYQD